MVGQDPAAASLPSRSPAPASRRMQGADAVVAEPVHQLSPIKLPHSQQPPPRGTPTTIHTPSHWHMSHTGGDTGMGLLWLLSSQRERSLLQEHSSPK